MPDAIVTHASTRRSLVTRLKNWDDQAGWQRFFDTYWKLLFTVARRAGMSESDAEDVVQETVVAVAQHMPDFRYDPERGSFKNWLLVIVRRRIIQHFRKNNRRQNVEARRAPEPGETDLIERIPDPNAARIDQMWEEEWQRNILEAARERIRQRVDPRHLQIFDCYVVKGWSTDQIEKAFKITANHLYIIKHRVAALLKSETERLEAEMI